MDASARIAKAAPPAITWQLLGRGANAVPEGGRVPVAAMAIPTASPEGGRAYEFAGGVASARRGVEMLVEQRGAGGDRGVLDLLRRGLDVAPRQVSEGLHQIRVVAGQDVALDSYFQRVLQKPDFHVAAVTRPGEITFYGGRPYIDGAMFHEFGHVVQHQLMNAGWSQAMRADDEHLRSLKGSLTANQLGPVVPDADRRERWRARLQPGGVTGYADRPLRIDQDSTEDIAESMRLWMSEPWHQQAIASYRAEGSSDVVPMTFGQLYPARTKLLASLDSVRAAHAVT